MPTTEFQVTKFRVPSTKFLVSWSKFHNSKFRVPSSKFRVPSSEFQVPSPKFQVPSSEFRVPNSESRVPSSVRSGNHPGEGWTRKTLDSTGEPWTCVAGIRVTIPPAREARHVLNSIQRPTRYNTLTGIPYIRNKRRTEMKKTGPSLMSPSCAPSFISQSFPASFISPSIFAA